MCEYCGHSEPDRFFTLRELRVIFRAAVLFFYREARRYFRRLQIGVIDMMREQRQIRQRRYNRAAGEDVSDDEDDEE